ncbi:hypothetical protein NDU88_008294 [Pleurodeles waltl]|uniref:Uncharacterized protein n=1 Tax=Pleurodeles waltl TaxID=8319 RepID=A0AAV7RU86_PLEWA|nr:hypothetical protein NDU88_008294 [Pleurodeles waltl]
MRRKLQAWRAMHPIRDAPLTVQRIDFCRCLGPVVARLLLQGCAQAARTSRNRRDPSTTLLRVPGEKSVLLPPLHTSSQAGPPARAK